MSWHRFFGGSLSFSAHGVLCVAASCLDIVLGTIGLTSRPRDPLHRAFFGFSLASFAWVFGYGMMSLVGSDALAFEWYRAAFIGVLFIPSSLFCFSRRMGQKEANFIERIGWIVSFAMALVALTWTQALCTIHTFPWGRFNLFLSTPFAETYFAALMSLFAFFTGAAYWEIVRAYRATGGIERRCHRNILIGFTVCYTGMLDFAATKSVPLYPFGYLSLTVLVVTITYTMVRYGLWNIQLTVQRLSLMVLVYVFLIGFSVPALWQIVSVRRWVPAGSAPSLIFLSLIFGGVLSLGPVIYAALVRRGFWLKTKTTVGLTHELKSPLGAIRGAIDLLKDRPDVAPEARAYLDMVTANAERLERYVVNLLQIAEIEENRVSLNRQQIALHDLLRDVVDEHHPTAEAKGVTMSLAAVPASVVGDTPRLRQAVSNIVSNAIKFTTAGKIAVRLAKERSDVRVTVEDTGIGLSGDAERHLFDRFYQGRSARGSGLGLTIAKAWVEAHGGRIWAESEGEGKGTTVTFTLPAGL